MEMKAGEAAGGYSMPRAGLGVPFLPFPCDVVMAHIGRIAQKQRRARDMFEGGRTKVTGGNLDPTIEPGRSKIGPEQQQKLGIVLDGDNAHLGEAARRCDSKAAGAGARIDNARGRSRYFRFSPSPADHRRHDALGGERDAAGTAFGRRANAL